MLTFLIKLYEKIIDTFNYLVSDDEEATLPADYIITINDPSNEPPIATYDQLFMETNIQEPYSLKQLVPEVHIPAPILARTTTPTSHQTFEEIHLQESMMLTRRVMEDYYVAEDQHTPQKHIDYEDGWEFVERCT
jgi:hypothetical protein